MTSLGSAGLMLRTRRLDSGWYQRPATKDPVFMSLFSPSASDNAPMHDDALVAAAYGDCLGFCCLCSLCSAPACACAPRALSA